MLHESIQQATSFLKFFYLIFCWVEHRQIELQIYSRSWLIQVKLNLYGSPPIIVSYQDTYKETYVVWQHKAQTFNTIRTQSIINDV